MTALEAIPKITELLGRLVKLSKDRETGSLIQQIQQHQLVVHSELMQKDANIRELELQNLELQRQLTEAKAEEFFIHSESGIEFRCGQRTKNKWSPFCPKCHLPAHSFGRTAEVRCSDRRCGWESAFERDRLDRLLKELNP